MSWTPYGLMLRAGIFKLCSILLVAFQEPDSCAGLQSNGVEIAAPHQCLTFGCGPKRLQIGYFNLLIQASPFILCRQRLAPDLQMGYLPFPFLSGFFFLFGGGFDYLLTQYGLVQMQYLFLNEACQLFTHYLPQLIICTGLVVTDNQVIFIQQTLMLFPV